ncbi:MAG TPA: hypothetical protein PLO16_12665 [Acidocella sp.]|nr:hypothetical protein [Acidocella sp.]
MEHERQPATMPAGDVVTMSKAELEAMLAKVADQSVAQFRTELLTKANGAPRNDTSDSEDFTQKLALAIAELSDQGTNRKRVAPEILAARAAAHDRMVKLIMKARNEKLRPEYRVISEIYFNERRVQPFKIGPNKTPEPVDILWSGVPNEALRPLNDIAREIYAEFKSSIGNGQHVTAGQWKEDNRPVWITAGGLVVKGDGPVRRQISGLGDPEPNLKPAFEDEFDVKSFNDPRAPEVRILGTIAPPARQNAEAR